MTTLDVHIDLMPEDSRLRRQVVHDSRNVNYRAIDVLNVRDSKIREVVHERKLPIFDQGSIGSCHDPATDILTADGWKPFRELTGSELLASVDPDTQRMIFERPTRIIAKHYSGDMHYVSGRSKDFAVTADHKMVVRPWDEARRTLGADYVFVDMQDVGWYAGLIACARHEDGDLRTSYTLPGVEHKTRPEQRVDREVSMAAWLRFLGIYLAEGTVLRQPGRYKVQIAAFKEREKTFARQVLADLGVHALELRDRFTFENKQVYAELTRLGLRGVKAGEKFVPRFVRDLAPGLIEQFLLGHWMSDGCESASGLISHYTSSPQLADDIQELNVLAGKWSTQSNRPPRTSVASDGRTIRGTCNEYRVSSTEKRTLSIERKNDVRVEHYEGPVYCAEVPTFHTLVTRRNGKVLISGNCTANAAYGMLSAGPLYDPKYKWNNEDTKQLYREETRLDESIIPGVWEPTDTGSTGQYAMIALQKRGLIKNYAWCFGLTEVLLTLQVQPVCIGIRWYQSMSDDVLVNGVMTVNTRSRALGGHEIVLDAVDPHLKMVRFANSWSTSWGHKGYGWFKYADLDALLKNQGDAVTGIR